MSDIVPYLNPALIIVAIAGQIFNRIHVKKLERQILNMKARL